MGIFIPNKTLKHKVIPKLTYDGTGAYVSFARPEDKNGPSVGFTLMVYSGGDPALIYLDGDPAGDAVEISAGGSIELYDSTPGIWIKAGTSSTSVCVVAYLLNDQK